MRITHALASFIIFILLIPSAPAADLATPPVGPITPTGESPAATGWRTETVVEGLSHPWSVLWLPDDQTMLITERSGSLRLARDGELSNHRVEGLPDILAYGQGGLMDISLHPDFEQNRLLYFTYVSGVRKANRTTLTRGVLSRDLKRLDDVEVLFRVSQDKSGGQHFGSRLLWLSDGTLLMSVGDGGNPPTKVGGHFSRLNAQVKTSHLGKTLRLTENGEPAGGNPFVNDSDAAPHLYSYGHRNIQGMAIDPATQRIYATEHGSRGGDELNLITPGTNYGWPAVTYSIEYWGPRISDDASAPGMQDPMVVWTPCIAPSGLCFYTGDRYPGWQGDLFAGGLALRQIRRVDLEDGRVVGQETLKLGQRVRDVRQGPDGYLYVLTDEGNGKLLRIVPTP
ncbi:PQQ-dependent sugar dehydrogenase [Mucisphaera calidilacus]|uniref:Soluble aldose sugar dehydrogenase YliI n=1 Tax=Mucisphaera calidilacus TaxID=2527982 RepID=A0A518BVD1_9BACT|nr:PQQ-dependent sugar dehydrogenase [Mucisphaera calidilacus]QDU70911.1 Soluble aldose sugar dehydrogenase YliI precursor [Mucisphaera calidilacus]